MHELAGHVRRSIDEALSEARLHLSLDQRQEASQRYMRASRLMSRYAEYAPNRKVKQARLLQTMRFREIARNVFQRKPEIVGSRNLRGSRKSAHGGHKKRKTHSDRIDEWLMQSSITWDDIGGLESAKTDIQFALALALATLPEGISLPVPKTILFYGPPGTGKTLLAAATSSSLVSEVGDSSSFFNVRLSSILSKYFGESSRIITELYDAARDMAPSVVFLDEFDALSRDRDIGDSGPERRILASILAELDGLTGKGNSSSFVLTIAATNRPWDIDSAVLSRFEKRVEIPIPDEHTRESIFACHLNRIGVPIDVDVQQLVELTIGYSGREIERLIKDVLVRMLTRENSQIIEILKKDPSVLSAEELRVTPLTWTDFELGTKHIRPETSLSVQKRYREWGKIV